MRLLVLLLLSCAAALGVANRTFCQNWYPARPPNCYQTGLVRVHQALEDENCMAALQTRENARNVGIKIKKLRDETPFVFLRGTAALFYYDMFCEDRTFVAIQANPHRFVISNGDCHPENFGNLMMANGRLSFGVNDFDQAFRAPFTWDVKRGAVAFVLACLEKDVDPTVCHSVVQRWLDGYFDVVRGNCTFLNDDRLLEGSRFLRRKEARMVRETMEEVRRKYDRRSGIDKFLRKKVRNMEFIESDNVKPLPRHRVPEFQEVINQYVYGGVPALVQHPAGTGFWKVHAVARKLGSGTGSLGLDRYWILLNGDHNGPVILDMKQIVTGVLENYLNLHLTDKNEMIRVLSMIKGTQPFMNLFFGTATHNGLYFIIQEKSMYKSAVDVGSLNEEDFLNYAYVTGRAQAFLHIEASCGSSRCALHEFAIADVQSCKMIREEFENEPNLMRSILEVAFQSAQRHVQYHEALKQAFVNCPFLEEDPVMFLSHEVVGRCEGPRAPLFPPKKPSS